MPAVVADASPLIYLTRLGHFGWLREFYGEVLIPPAVWSEITDDGPRRPEATEMHRAVREGWMRVHSPEALASDAVREALDPGETEAISLACELGVLLLIDEQAGRRVATRIVVRITGTLDILAEAKSRGLIPTLRQELDRLANETTFRLSAPVRALVLREAGESDQNG
jgi:uncharacterized protein